MKSLKTLILFLSFVTIGNAQTDGDSIKLSIKTVIETAEKMRALEQSDSTKTLQINNLKAQVTNLNLQVVKLEDINKKNESIISLKDTEIDMYRRLADRFIELPTIKQKWYQTPTFMFVSGFVAGGLTIYAGAHIVSLIR